jgi:hypothetical protein
MPKPPKGKNSEIGLRCADYNFQRNDPHCKARSAIPSWETTK